MWKWNAVLLASVCAIAACADEDPAAPPAARAAVVLDAQPQTFDAAQLEAIDDALERVLPTLDSADALRAALVRLRAAVVAGDAAVAAQTSLTVRAELEMMQGEAAELDVVSLTVATVEAAIPAAIMARARARFN